MCVLVWVQHAMLQMLMMGGMRPGAFPSSGLPQQQQAQPWGQPGVMLQPNFASLSAYMAAQQASAAAAASAAGQRPGTPPSWALPGGKSNR